MTHTIKFIRMNLQLIKTYSEKYPGGVRKLAIDSGMSEANLHRCIRNNKIQASDLEAISRCLGVGVEIFFAEAQTAQKTKETDVLGDIVWLQEKIKLLEQRINDKDELIKLLKQ